MDVSLDDYIDTNVEFKVQISNPNALVSKGQGRGRGRGRGRGVRGMGRGGFQQRGGLFTSKTNNPNQGQFSGNARPLSVTVNNNFDARDTIAQKKRPVDARNKLVAKAKLSDARTKILNLKGNKGGLVNKGQTNKSSDARAMILARKNNKQMATTGNRAGVGVQSINLQRTVNQDDGNFQITRKVPGNQSGVQMSGDNVVITRTLQGSQSLEFSDNLFFTKTISNQQGLGNLQPNVRGPVIQLQNEMFHAHARPQTQPMYSHAMAYDEVDDPWGQISYPSEKTLTVKMPQSHSQFSRVPQQKFQMNKITFDGVRTVPTSPISPPTAIKRKAAGDAMSVMTGKQLRLGGVVTTTKQTRPITQVPQSAPQVVKRTKVLKPAPAQAVMEEEEDPTGMVLSPLQGYRILISNLHVIVTQDDIIELFGAIGPMKRARLLKPGTAEVVYVQKDDALKAAQKYHNRELDGQSMQVKLITSAKAPVKQAPEVTAVPSQPAKEKGGPLRLGQNIKKKAPGDNVELNTLHRALFKTQANKQIKPVTFTVKI